MCQDHKRSNDIRIETLATPLIFSEVAGDFCGRHSSQAQGQAGPGKQMPDLRELRKEQEVRVETINVSSSFKPSGCRGVKRERKDQERDEKSK